MCNDNPTLVGFFCCLPMEVIAIDPAFGYPKSVRAELVEALRQAQGERLTINLPNHYVLYSCLRLSIKR
ncbi:MAG: hypothetical protein KBG45_04190 [Ottowia sp.]|nr:hypothetical protein [Ottowia sp.]